MGYAHGHEHVALLGIRQLELFPQACMLLHAAHHLAVVVVVLHKVKTSKAEQAHSSLQPRAGDV